MATYASAPGQTYTFSVFLDHFRNDLGLSSTLISTLYLIGTLTASVLVIGIGRALDHFGGRVMLVLAGLSIGLGSLWMSQVSGAVELLIGFAIMRTLGQGALGLIPTTVVSIWFIRRRAKVLAILGLGGALGIGTFPIISTGLISIFEWRGAWVAIAFIAWGLILLPAGIFARRSPESVGLLPDGDRSSIARVQAVDRSENEIHFTAKQAIQTRALWLLMFAASAQSIIGTGLMFHQILIFEGQGLSSTIAAAVFGVFAPSVIAGQFVSGYFSDKFNIRYVIAAGQIPLALSVLLILFMSESWQAFLYGGLLGLAVGVLMNSTTSIWPDYFGRKHLGTIRGIAQFATMAASAAGPLPLAIVFDVTGSHTLGLIVFALLPLLGVVAALAATRPSSPFKSTGRGGVGDSYLA